MQGPHRHHIVEADIRDKLAKQGLAFSQPVKSEEGVSLSYRVVAMMRYPDNVEVQSYKEQCAEDLCHQKCSPAVLIDLFIDVLAKGLDRILTLFLRLWAKHVHKLEYVDHED